MEADSNNKKNQAVRIVGESVQFSGPIPPPSVIKQYGDIDASFPSRILSMAETEQEAVCDLNKQTLEIEKLRLELETSAIKRGQILGAAVAILFVFIACWTAISGYEKLAMAIVGSLAIMVTVMITGRHKSS